RGTLSPGTPRRYETAPRRTVSRDTSLRTRGAAQRTVPGDNSLQAPRPPCDAAIAALFDLGPGLREQLPQDRPVAAALVLAIATHREVRRVRQRGEQLDVVLRIGTRH